MGTGLFQIVEQASLPGICRTCGVPFGVRPMLDSSLNSDYCNTPHADGSFAPEMQGSVYFCIFCVTSMAQVFGLQPPHVVEQLKEDLEIERTLKNIANERILGLESIVNGYQSLSINSSFTPTYTVPNEVATPVQEGDTLFSEHGGGDAGNGEPESNPVTSPDGSNVPEDEVRREGRGDKEIDELIGEPGPVDVSDVNEPERESGNRSPEYDKNPLGL